MWPVVTLGDTTANICVMELEKLHSVRFKTFPFLSSSYATVAQDLPLGLFFGHSFFSFIVKFIWVDDVGS